MPWCPNCKNEYREGITECADCGVELVDELPEEEDEYKEPVPVVMFLSSERNVCDKLVRYLKLNGIYSAECVKESVEDEEEDTYALIVADIEKDSFFEILPGAVEGEDINEDRMYELVPDLEDRLDEIDSEEASMQFSEIRSEASSVYVHKKDKYADLKFSGYSFIAFGFVGFAVVALNALKVINLFNLYSMIIMSLVFVIFFGIGISSLMKASKIKKSVEVEDEFTEQIQEWIKDNLTGDLIAEWYDENREDQENYFDITEKLQKMLAEEFPNINPSYIDELADERYNDYLESSAYEDPEDIPVAADDEDEEEEI